MGVSNNESASFLKLLEECLAKNEIRCGYDGPGHYSGYPSDIYPEYYTIGRADALKWAKAKGFDVSQIE
jgi:hypothetical protein